MIKSITIMADGRRVVAVDDIPTEDGEGFHDLTFHFNAGVQPAAMQVTGTPEEILKEILENYVEMIEVF